MTWARVKAVFLDALDRPEGERAAFVAKACAGDEHLRAEVDSLLASEKAAGSLCETPAAGLLADTEFEEPLAPRLPPGTRLGNYELTSFLAAGGMGEVYRARHTVLGRPVAIKTLSKEGGSSLAKRRLIREAQHAAILDHANVCKILEIGDEDGVPFIVMELVEGRSLRDLVQDGVPPLEQTLALCTQVADALHHAHAHEIVHRDLKASNVMVDGRGRAIVLDFGLARRIPHATDAATPDSTLTAAGAVAGTLSHMAPEVLLGGKADVRSDVWSLGVLLFEMTSGTLPFNGRTPFETSSAILSGPPRRLGNQVPLGLRLVIERCLAKDPDARYQRAADVRDALHSIARRHAWPVVGRLFVSARWRTLALWAGAVFLASIGAGALRRSPFTGSAPGVQVSTLAVLPMETAADSTSAYYGEGITEAIVNRLGAIADARIVAPTPAASGARTATSRAEFAKRLHADALVELRLRRSPDRVAVDVRLVEPSGGRVIWSDTYERETRQVLALQDDIVRALIAEVRLVARPGTRVEPSRAVNPDAYESYLKGRFEWNKRTKESLTHAVEHFTRAVELDPTYAPAHAALADCYNQFGTQLMGTGSPRDFRPRAEAEAIRALQIDPYSAEAHAALGYVRHYNWQWAEAEREFLRAIELNPSYPLAHMWYANLLMSRRRFDEAIHQVRLALELDPFSLVVGTNVGWVLRIAGRPAEAISQLRQTLALDSTYVQAHVRLADALADLGRFAEARHEAETVARLTSNSASARAALAAVDARAGRTAAARRELALLVERSRTEFVPPGAIAVVYAYLGDTLNQSVWLRKAYAEHSNALAYLMADQQWHRDAAFLELAAAVGLR